jgi:hypothetical protein
MKASDLIQHLQEVVAKHGDIKVVSTEQDYYWGTIYNEIYEKPTVMEDCPLNGPKSWVTEKAIVLGRD